MPRRKVTFTPAYCLHKSSGKAIVRIDGKDHYLGRYGTPESHAKYDEVIATWLAHGRTLPEVTKPTATPATPTGITIVELVNRYREWSAVEYGTGPNSEHRTQMDAAIPLVRLFGRLEAQRFGPVALREVRQTMINGTYRTPRPGEKMRPLSRVSINMRMGRIRRIFKWAIGQELIPASVFHALQAVEPLRAGRGNVPDKKPVKPVSEEIVNATIPHLPWPVGDMVQLQLLTGCRSGELVIMRGCDLDMTGRVWIYRPARHKTQRLGVERIIYLGPEAQRIVRPYLTTDLTAYLFSPRAARLKRFQSLRAARKSKVQPSQRDRRRQRPKRLPGVRYTVDSYGRAIARACEVGGIPHWHPHQLRHTSATKLRREYGVDVARVILGHSGLDATAIYAEADRAKAVEVMSKLG